MLFRSRDIVRQGLPPDISEKLATALRAGRETPLAQAGVMGQGRRVRFEYLSTIDPAEHLFRVTEVESGNVNDVLREQLQLTQREAEVLTWIAHGKSNRDIGEILGISPRTVNKHLEQIFTKLGVENRTSAAAQATKILALKA